MYRAETPPRGIIFNAADAGVHFAGSTMRMKSPLRTIVFTTGLLLVAWPASVGAQTAGSIEFSAHVAPTGGRPEPVRQLTFYLLRKSFDDIRAEAVQLEPTPDLGHFVDGLAVSPELKAWMKKHHSVQLVGADFTKSLTPDDILDVPEFFKAYMSRNMGFKGNGFPDPKFKEKDMESNPEKFKRQKEEYREALRRFIAVTPESVAGIDLDFGDINPSPKWEHLLSDQRQRLDARTVELSQHYLAGQTDTDLEGRGSFTGLAPGAYWISMIGVQAMSGDVRLRWDLPVTVRQGQTTRVELTNLNATNSYRAAQDSNH